MLPSSPYLPDDDEARSHPLRDDGWELLIVSDEILETDRFRRRLRIYDAIPPPRKKYPCPGSYPVEENSDPERVTSEDTVKCEAAGEPFENRWTQKTYNDVNRNRKLIQIRVLRRRFTCPDPKCPIKTFTEKLKAIDEDRHITVYLRQALERDVMQNRTMTDIAAEFGIAEQRIRDLDKAIVRSEDTRRLKKRTLKLPDHVGIHPMRIAKTDGCLLTDVEENSVWELVKSQQSDVLAEKITSLFLPFQFKNVRLVSIPLNPSFREMARKLFPQALVMVPKNYLERMAHQPLAKILDSSKRDLKLNKETAATALELLCTRRGQLSQPNRRALDALTSKSSIVREAYEQKELFLHVLTHQSEETAFPHYQEWAANVPASVRTEFDSLIGGFAGWEQEIFSRFDLNYRKYLAPTARLIRALEKQSPLYSFETIRGRVLYGDGVRILTQLPPPTEFEKYLNFALETPRSFLHPNFFEDLGSSIDKLIEYFETPLTFTTNHE